MNYNWVIIVATIGFLALAFILLFPIYRFLVKQEKISEQWTKENIDRLKSEGSEK